MRLTYLAALAAPLLAGAAPLQAQGMLDGLSPYLQLRVGASMTDREKSFDFAGGSGFGNVKSSYVASGAVGIATGFGLRLEAEAAHHGNRKTNGRQDLFGLVVSADSRIDVFTAMANAYYDIDFGMPFIPYVGGGLGWARVKTDSLNIVGGGLGLVSTEPGTTRDQFAWSLMAGVAYKLDRNWSVDLGYRYLDAGKAETSGRGYDATGAFLASVAKTRQELHLHEVSLGVRYQF